MSNQPEALRLAQALNNRQECEDEAADELRRLLAENEELWKEREDPHKTIEMYVSECNRLERERDALKAQRDDARRTVREAHEAGTRLTAQRERLLDACRFYASMMGRRKSDGEPFYMTALDLDCGDRARAAIKAVEGEKA